MNIAKKEDIYEFFRENTKDEELYTALCEFYENRNELKRPMTKRACKMLLSELEKLAPGNDMEKVKIIKQSIFYGWRGVFPVKNNNVYGGSAKKCRNNPYLNMLRGGCIDKN